MTDLWLSELEKRKKEHGLNPHAGVTDQNSAKTELAIAKGSSESALDVLDTPTVSVGDYGNSNDPLGR
jgi:hypothetical protein